MITDISGKELLAGTSAYRRNHPEAKEWRLSWLNRQCRANATTDEPDMREFMNIYGSDLTDEVQNADWTDLLSRCATPIDRNELSFWLDQLQPHSEVLRALSGMFSDNVVSLFCLIGSKQILSVEVFRQDKTFLVYPPDTSSDFLAEETDETLNADRLFDPADSSTILSAIFAEWLFGRPKSTAARQFICSVCNKAEGLAST